MNQILNLTLKNMMVDGVAQGDNQACQYVISNNCGALNLVGNTSVTAPESAVVFDVCVTGYYPEGVTVTVDTTGLYIYIFRQFFKGMPRELEEAAYMDGCGYMSTFLRIMVP